MEISLTSKRWNPKWKTSKLFFTWRNNSQLKISKFRIKSEKCSMRVLGFLCLSILPAFCLEEALYPLYNFLKFHWISSSRFSLKLFFASKNSILKQNNKFEMSKFKNYFQFWSNCVDSILIHVPRSTQISFFSKIFHLCTLIL